MKVIVPFTRRSIIISNNRVDFLNQDYLTLDASTLFTQTNREPGEVFAEIDDIGDLRMNIGAVRFISLCFIILLVLEIARYFLMNITVLPLKYIAKFFGWNTELFYTVELRNVKLFIQQL